MYRTINDLKSDINAIELSLLDPMPTDTRVGLVRERDQLVEEVLEIANGPPLGVI